VKRAEGSQSHVVRLRAAPPRSRNHARFAGD